jgi:hypothetical protein
MQAKMKAHGAYLTYNNNACTDGIGAQIQRIVSVYAISRQLNVNYAHTYIKEFDPQIFNNLDIDAQKEELQKWKIFFSEDLRMREDVNPRLTINMKCPRNGFLVKILNRLCQFLRFSILIPIESPRNFTDSKPESLSFVPEIFNIDNLGVTLKPGNQLLTVIHIRMGELALSQFADRYLPLSYFETVLTKLEDSLSKNKLSHSVLIPTEFTKKKLRINDPKIIESMRINPSNPSVRKVDDGFVEIVHEQPSEETPFLAKATWLPPGNAFEDFVLMASSDILIISKSSFSFLAGLSNPKSIKIYSKFWHSTPSSWVDAEELESRLESSLLGLMKL